MKLVEIKTFVDEEDVTVTSYGNWKTVDEFDELIIFLRVTAVNTAGTLDVKIQTKDPDGNAVDLTNCVFTQVTSATSNQYMAIVVFGSQVRAYYTVASGGDYDFTVKAYAKGVK